jgi:hypothetical protein
MDTPAVLRAVADGRVDVGLVRSTEDVRLRTIRLERQGVVLHASHPLGARTAVTLADLAAHPILMHRRDANPGHYDAVMGLFAGTGLTPRIVQRPVAFDPSRR